VQEPRGYVRVFVPEHPKAFCNGWVYEHRLVAERMLGRLLGCGEQVHHISEQKNDNRERNLFVCWADEHQKAHGLAFSA
jgi:hypothetical protein